MQRLCKVFGRVYPGIVGSSIVIMSRHKTTTMKIQDIARQKAATLLNRRVDQIIAVTMCDSYGVGVHCTDGNRLNIPYEVWALGVSETEYERTVINRV